MCVYVQVILTITIDDAKRINFGISLTCALAESSLRNGCGPLLFGCPLCCCCCFSDDLTMILNGDRFDYNALPLDSYKIVITTIAPG